MKLNKQVQAQIESLTDNEDFKQDLWVAHLSGQQQLPHVLKTIQIQHDKNEEFQLKVRQHAISNVATGVVQLLNNFSGIERSVLYMLFLGYNVHTISNHYGTSSVRIQQCIDTIKKHSIWDKLLVLV